MIGNMINMSIQWMDKGPYMGVVVGNQEEVCCIFENNLFFQRY
jgi:hypothetical protein